MAAKREPKDLLADAEKLKLEGNQAYADKSFKAAIRLYHKSLLFARAAAAPSSASLMGLQGSSSDRSNGAEVTEAKKLMATCHNNIAAVILSNPDSVKKDFERAADHCREVLNVEENNSKALYRLGQAQFHTGDFEKAVDNLNKAIKAGASASAVAKVRQSCLDELQLRKERQKQEWKGLFDRHKKNPSSNVIIPPEILELFTRSDMTSDAATDSSSN